jgi:hypothetical protein
MDYKKIYDQICERAKKESNIRIQRRKLWKSSKGSEGIYYESHHVIPVCLGGTGSIKQWKAHENIVLLIAREHFLCHWLLHEMHPNNRKLALAFNLMCRIQNIKQSRYKPSSRIIEYAKEIDKKSRLGISGFWKGKKLSKETKEKISLANIGKKQTKETIERRHKSKINSGAYKKQGEKIKGTKWTEKQREKVKLWHNSVGYKHSDEIKQRLKVPKKKICCPHCKKIGGLPQMKQWHFNNCKLLKN